MNIWGIEGPNCGGASKLEIMPVEKVNPSVASILFTNKRMKEREEINLETFQKKKPTRDGRIAGNP